MQVTDAVVAGEVSRLVFLELEEASERREFGVLVRDIRPYDPGRLAELLSNSAAIRNSKLHAALIDCELGKHANKNLTNKEEIAVGWRNEKLKTIAVVTDRPLTKQASLRDFRRIGEADLVARTCREQEAKADVRWLKALWSALANRKKLPIPLRAVSRYALVLQELTPETRSLEAARHLAALGLFPDERLPEQHTDQNIVKRLRDNREQVEHIRRATEDDWARVAAYTRSLAAGKAKTEANRLAKDLKRLANAPADEQEAILSKHEFEPVRRLWLGRPERQGSGPGPGPGRAKRVELEVVVGELMLAHEHERLGEIATELTQILALVLDGDESKSEQTVHHASEGTTEAVVEADSRLLQLVRNRTTATDWGGTLTVVADQIDVLLDSSSILDWAPTRITRAIELASRFVESEAAPALLPELLTQLDKARAALLPVAGELAMSPVAVLAGRPALLDAAHAYIQRYDDLLRALANAFAAMQEASANYAEELLSIVLAFELYVYKKEVVTEVVLSPLHPLQLWRAATVVSETLELSAALSDAEAEALKVALAEDIQLLPALLVPAMVAGADKPQLFGQAGLLGRLQIFRSAPRGMLEPDGVRTVADLAERFAALRPFAQSGLQIMLVDAPRAARFVEALLDRLDLDERDDPLQGVHIRLRHTEDELEANEAADLSDTAQERLTSGEARGVASLSALAQKSSWDSILQELRDAPAHIVVVIDPFEVKAQTVHRLAQQPVGPWMPTLSYRFDALDNEIQPIPVADDEVFGIYRAAAALLETSLHRRSPANLPQVAKQRVTLTSVAGVTAWTVLADPHRVPIPRLGESELIDRRLDRGRQLTSYGKDLMPFVRRLDAQLRKTHFAARRETLEKLVRALAAMEPDGILRLGHTSSDAQVKGSLGKVVAALWYREREPHGLAVSLDTPAAARWLVAGAHGREKADLLGLSEEEGAVRIDVIEVKTHDEGTPYVVQDGVIRGGAVDQVLATLEAVSQVFAPDAKTPLAKPRREVLRDHLYSALCRDPDPAYVRRWFHLLEDIFMGRTAVKLSARIVHVQLAAIAQTPTVNYVTATGQTIQVHTLSAGDVGLTLDLLKGGRASATKLPPGSSKDQPAEDPSTVLARLRAMPSTVAEQGPPGAATREGAPPGEAPKDTPATKPDVPPPRATTGTTLEVALGREHASNVEVRWVPSRQTNGFLLVLGSSGSGKTESLKRVGMEIRRHGIPVLVFDFHGDVTFSGLASHLLSSGTASVARLNPLELDSTDAAISGLYDQRKTLLSLVTRAVPALGHRQRNLLKDAIESAYERAGYTDDPATWTRSAPVFQDISDILGEWIDDDEKKGSRSAIEGCIAAVDNLFGHPIFRHGELLTLEQLMVGATRLDLSKLSDEVRFVATETLLRKIFRALRLRGPIPVQPESDLERYRLFVIIDEAKILSMGGGQRDSTANILNELITEARKFGLGMILASQMSDHFSDEVRENAASWLVLKPNDKEARKNAPSISVEPEDLMRLQGRGDGYFKDRPGTRARRIQVAPVQADPA